jgi:hypothetical protein
MHIILDTSKRACRGQEEFLTNDQKHGVLPRVSHDSRKVKCGEKLAEELLLRKTKVTIPFVIQHGSRKRLC